MRRIVVMNSKGGCGKTTIATNLASCYANAGFTTALFDHDSQRSSSHWLSVRGDGPPPVHGVTAFEPHRPGMTRSWQLRMPPETQRIVVDTPASMDRIELMERLRGAHTILIPVLPSPIDTFAAADFIRDLFLVGKIRSERTRLGIIPNRIRRNTLAFQALRRFLTSLNIPVVAQLRDTQGYVRATDQGLGIHELKEPRLCRDRSVWHAIMEWADGAQATRRLQG